MNIPLKLVQRLTRTDAGLQSMHMHTYTIKVDNPGSMCIIYYGECFKKPKFRFFILVFIFVLLFERKNLLLILIFMIIGSGIVVALLLDFGWFTKIV